VKALIEPRAEVARLRELLDNEVSRVHRIRDALGEDPDLDTEHLAAYRVDERDEARAEVVRLREALASIRDGLQADTERLRTAAHKALDAFGPDGSMVDAAYAMDDLRDALSTEPAKEPG
jgi:hypothetical protein